MYDDAISNYHAQLEYINKVFKYIEYARKNNVHDPLGFIEEFLASDRRVITGVVDILLEYVANAEAKLPQR